MLASVLLWRCIASLLCGCWILMWNETTRNSTKLKFCLQDRAKVLPIKCLHVIQLWVQNTCQTNKGTNKRDHPDKLFQFVRMIFLCKNQRSSSTNSCIYSYSWLFLFKTPSCKILQWPAKKYQQATLCCWSSSQKSKKQSNSVFLTFIVFLTRIKCSSLVNKKKSTFSFMCSLASVLLVLWSPFSKCNFL